MALEFIARSYEFGATGGSRLTTRMVRSVARTDFGARYDVPLGSGCGSGCDCGWGCDCAVGWVRAALGWVRATLGWVRGALGWVCAVLGWVRARDYRHVVPCSTRASVG